MHNIHNQHALDLSLFHGIDINLYPLFIAIYEQKSISKAALSLYISQSAASHALQRLRNHFKDDLFVRVGAQMCATAFATQIYPVIRQALLDIQHVALQQQKFDPSMINTFKIALHDEIEPLILPKLVAHFEQLQLQVELSSIKLDRKNVVTDLVTQQIDFFIDLEQDFGHKVHFDALLADHFVVCSQQDNMSLQQYLAAQHIGVSSRRSGMLIEDIYLNRLQHSRQLRLRCQHYATAIEILRQQADLMLTLPYSILQQFSLDSRLHVFDLPFEIPKMQLGLFSAKELQQNSRIQYLREQIFSIFA
ncbi:LysR family transcriptional regulator [Acinetobacter larvae]|uniref:LysR family transcriptional regulator n=1 Tax=Acinetobacter larvae TaxID=1789224 RepID=A0A1B2M056_9GAMM|nr:LysR family transcriptional regulator [Acinetobacter larvae]AOA58423.1 LysR family transcriptional regulator [Acinetobacter larvae]